MEFPWNEVVPAKQLYGEGLLIQRAIILQLLEDFSNCKATLNDGYFVAPPTIWECTGDGKVRQDSSNVLFPVVFNCITFKPKGRFPVWLGKQDHETGVFLSCGPIRKVFLPPTKMGDCHHFPGENSFFQNDKDSQIEKYAEVRFKVLDTRWIE
ncbi:hypothetical protein MKW92_032489 [Papaver armeniacum]|nr:hypothetical protein MKW92_032489 [Papaver armeniacum]